MKAMTEHLCEFPFDESDYGREVQCRFGCGQRRKVVMVGEGDLTLESPD